MNGAMRWSCSGSSALKETRHRYMQGMTDYLPVLSSLSSLQKLERLSQPLLLYRVLGGSLLDTASAQLPSPATNQ